MRSLYAAALAVFLCLPIQPAAANFGQCYSVEFILSQLQADKTAYVVYRDPGEVKRAIAVYNAEPGGSIDAADMVIVAIRPKGQDGMIAYYVTGTDICALMRMPTSADAAAFLRAVLGVEA